jgi:hypothetical protein
MFGQKRKDRDWQDINFQITQSSFLNNYYEHVKIQGTSNLNPKKYFLTLFFSIPGGGPK